MAEERVQRRLAAIFAADVVGYSRLIEADEEGTRSRLRDVQAELITPKISEDGGRIVKTMGDGILVEFPSAVDAVRSALSIQAEMADRNAELPESQRLVFRIGINLGDVIIEGDDIHGDGVNVAARLEGLCEPGTVYISGNVFEQVTNKLAMSFDDLGERIVKNISRPVRVYRAAYGTGPGAEVAIAGEVLPHPSRPSIAILPFKNLGDDPSQDYLADGVRLAIQASLVYVPGLFLVAPPAVSRYRDQDVNVQQVGREVGARYVLEGSVQRSGERIRITVQLTDTLVRQIIWAERYDCDLSDALATQDEITSAVVVAIDAKLGSGQGREMFRDTLKNLDALHSFYRGLNHLYRRTRDDNFAAKEQFENVARLQPHSPLGPAYLCMTHWADATTGWTDSRKRSLDEALKWAERTIELKGTNGMAQIVLAGIHLLNKRHDKALATSYDALELRPNCPIATSHLANVLHYCGHSAEAVAKIRESMRIMQVYPPWFLTLLAAAYREIGDVEQSISTAKQELELSPTDIEARLILCSDYDVAGRQEDATKIAQEVMQIDPIFSVAKYVENQPYRDKVTVNRLAESLRNACLPE